MVNGSPQPPLSSLEVPSVPTIALPAKLHEGMEVDFNCSTPYVCPTEPVNLQWQGQDPTRSVTSHLQKLEPSGTSHMETLHMALSWQDHGRILSCQVSAAERRMQKEIHLQVQCECTGMGGHALPTLVGQVESVKP